MHLGQLVVGTNDDYCNECCSHKCYAEIDSLPTAAAAVQVTTIGQLILVSVEKEP